MSVVGVLTAGGDCPGLNAVIRGVVARADERDAEVVGIRNGWEGLMNGSTVSLDRDSVRSSIKAHMGFASPDTASRDAKADGVATLMTDVRQQWRLPLTEALLFSAARAELIARVMPSNSTTVPPISTARLPSRCGVRMIGPVAWLSGGMVQLPPTSAVSLACQ